MATILAEAAPSRPDKVEPGTVLGGRYRIEKVIGHGGFGTVFEAQHVGTGQRVAVKALDSSGAADNLEIRRFFQEARITAQLQHPNTVRVFDFGQGDDGLIYLVMELLLGQTLRKLMTQRKKEGSVITQGEAIEMGVQIASSLVEAHEAGLVHRDLKPDNIIIQNLSSAQTVLKVLDFGIAKVQDASLTKGKGTFGTPYYMSPEQSMGKALSGRSDIYGLGVMLYEMVSGSLPYLGDTPVSILYQHVHSEIPDVSQASRVPLDLDFVDIVHQCLQKSPSDRFENAQELCDALLTSHASESDMPSIPGVSLSRSAKSDELVSSGFTNTLKNPLLTDTQSNSAEVMPLDEPTRPQEKIRLSAGFLIVLSMTLVLFITGIYWLPVSTPHDATSIVAPIPKVMPRDKRLPSLENEGTTAGIESVQEEAKKPAAATATKAVPKTRVEPIIIPRIRALPAKKVAPKADKPPTMERKSPASSVEKSKNESEKKAIEPAEKVKKRTKPENNPALDTWVE